jgi:hypothetical protein
LHASRGFTRRLNGGQQQRHQHADDGNHHQQFYEREPSGSTKSSHEKNPHMQKKN